MLIPPPAPGTTLYWNEEWEATYDHHDLDQMVEMNSFEEGQVITIYRAIVTLPIKMYVEGGRLFPVGNDRKPHPHVGLKEEDDKL